LVYENVDTLEEGSQSGITNLDILMSELTSRGYEGQPTICEASRFGLPCRRRRLYVFFIQVNGNPLIDFAARDMDGCFREFRQFLASCMREAPSLEQVLLPPNDPAVQAELQSRQNRANHAEPMAAVSQADWPDAHMKLAAELRVLWGQSAGKRLQANPWYHTLLPREKNALPLLQIQSPASTAMVRDLSQSIQRANSITFQADTRKHVCPTLLSKQAMWVEPPGSSSQARLLLGREALLLQGFPIKAFLEFLDRFRQNQRSSSEGPLAGWDGLPTGFPTETLMADLAGNGMALPVLLAVTQSALACLCWRSTEMVPPIAEQSDVQHACAAVDIMSSEPASDAAQAAAAPQGQTALEGCLKRRRRV
jgi:site-specific DNA-cytosine methylase